MADKGGQKREKTKGFGVLSSLLLRESNKAVEVLTEEPTHLCITSVRKTVWQKFYWVHLTRHLKFLSIFMHFIHIGCDQRVVWYVCLIKDRSVLSFLRQECGKCVCVIVIEQSNFHVSINIPMALDNFLSKWHQKYSFLWNIPLLLGFPHKWLKRMW